MAELPPAPSPTIEAIYKAYEDAQESGYRAHLGASIIGTECDRALWYSHHWATRATHTGRLLRLFDTGNLAEARFVADLRRIGVTVLEVDPSTGRQWNLRDEFGHFGGSMDAVAIGLPECPKTWNLVELKTHGSKSFAKLKKEGVRKSKPLHWAQCQTYMRLAGLERAFYLAVNKDTDELHSERIKYDSVEADILLAKAYRIVKAARPPPKISNDPAWYLCRFCDHATQCHGDAMPERHCRSCLHSSPVQGGEWHCAKYDVGLTRRDQEIACDAHVYIPDLVPGTQTDVVGESIVYLMRDNSTWTDGVSV